jgi:hypothetical protein
MDKVEILRKLYDNAKPQGMGFFHFTPERMTTEEANILFNSCEDKYFDYVKGRVMKIDLNGDILDTYLYNRDNGDGSAEYILKDMNGFSEIEE